MSEWRMKEKLRIRTHDEDVECFNNDNDEAINRDNYITCQFSEYLYSPAASTCTHNHTFRPLTLAVTFDPDLGHVRHAHREHPPLRPDELRRRVLDAGPPPGQPPSHRLRSSPALQWLRDDGACRGLLCGHRRRVEGRLHAALRSLLRPLLHPLRIRPDHARLGQVTTIIICKTTLTTRVKDLLNGFL